MKRKCLFILFMGLIILLTACGEKTAINEKSSNIITQQEENYDVNNLENILSAITTEVETATMELTNNSASVFDKLGDSYNDYSKNKTSVTDFYESSLKSAEELYTTLDSVSIDYFKCVASQGVEDYDIWNDAMKDFYDTWNDGMKDFYDAWNDIYKNIYGKCDDLIKDALDELEYSEYSDVWSDMYGEYSDAWSNTYHNYSDTRSGFYNDKTDVDAILKAAADSKENNKDSETAADEKDIDGREPSVDAKPVDSKEYNGDDFLYMIYSDDTVEITGYTGNDSAVTIPSKIDGYSVSRIGTSAFEGCTGIESIVMWAKPICIGASAFKGCTNLDEFSIPSSVTAIDDSVFEDCTSLKNIIIWGKVTSIGKAAFKNCSSLEEVSVPSSCLMIGDYAFKGCANLESVIFWGGEVIGVSSFEDCTSLTDISIPSEVTTIGECAFKGCTSLESVIIWGDNVSIGVNAFANCNSLDKLPDGAVNTDVLKDNGKDISTDGIRPEFKEAIDSYEAFYDEYYDFMKKYSENPYDLGLLAEYADMISKAEDMDKAFESWDEDDMNEEELKYYLDVNDRVMQKMIDVLE